MLLLFTYSIGFAHNILPHNAFNLGQSEHNHQHIQTGSADEENYISHGNHFDTNWYDLIICALTDAEHGGEDCNLEHYIVPNTNSPLENIPTIQFVTLLFTFLTDETPDKPKIGYNINLQFSFLSPLLEHSPHRGPPAIIC